jgi:hypothetical protein
LGRCIYYVSDIGRVVSLADVPDGNNFGRWLRIDEHIRKAETELSQIHMPNKLRK